MQYLSTRDASLRYSASQAIVQGLSREGGLFLPETIPQVTLADLRALSAMSYQQRAVWVMKQYLEEFSEEELEEYAAKASLVENAEVYQGCAISVAGELPPKAQVAVPQAANDLLTIDGVEASFVAVEKNGGVNISARSMGAVNVQVILETLGGGGHLTMAGAQLKGVNQDEARRRIQDAVRAFRQEQAEKARSSAAQTE